MHEQMVSLSLAKASKQVLQAWHAGDKCRAVQSVELAATLSELVSFLRRPQERVNCHKHWHHLDKRESDRNFTGLYSQEAPWLNLLAGLRVAARQRQTAFWSLCHTKDCWYRLHLGTVTTAGDEDRPLRARMPQTRLHKPGWQNGSLYLSYTCHSLLQCACQECTSLPGWE